MNERGYFILIKRKGCGLPRPLVRSNSISPLIVNKLCFSTQDYISTKEKFYMIGTLCNCEGAFLS